jgi:methionyl-tRNA formyltransferase
MFCYENRFYGNSASGGSESRKNLRDGHEVAAVWTQPDKPAGRGNKLTASPVKEFALENNLTVYQPTKIKTAESLALFQSHHADVAVVVAYGRILPETFLQAFSKGAINVHFSLLPKYRGAAPVNWAIVNGEEKSGVTTMQMDAGLDTGGILLQRETEIRDGENAIELMQRLALTGADLLSETLAMRDELIVLPQDDSRATFAPIMKKEDGAIDWNSTALEIQNRVRGFQPFPGSYTKYQDKKLTIWKAREIQDSGFKVQDSGSVLEAKGDKLFIRCGNQTVLQIAELQLEGKRRMLTRDFLNGVKITAGESLS